MKWSIIKKAFSLTLGALIISGNAFAMFFSQPTKIGRFGQTQGPGGPGFVIDNASYNDGDFYTKYEKNNRRTYGKGVARWGNGNDALYLHYNAYSDFARFGDKSLDNTINDRFAGTPILADIMKIDNNSNKVLYVLFTSYDLGEEDNYDVIGVHSNGKWVKYFDTNNTIGKAYFGDSFHWGVHFGKMDCKGDSIVIPYKRYDKNQKSRTLIEQGEFRFKWDDKAQWFGIEQVVY